MAIPGAVGRYRDGVELDVRVAQAVTVGPGRRPPLMGTSIFAGGDRSCASLPSRSGAGWARHPGGGYRERRGSGIRYRPWPVPKTDPPWEQADGAASGSRPVRAEVCQGDPSEQVGNACRLRVPECAARRGLRDVRR